jgi:D-glycerate 3-kinase
MFDAFIHIDAADTKWVYEWRLQAERKMRQEKGKGMTDEQVIKFVDGCTYKMSLFPLRYTSTSSLTPDYPAYELYTETLRNGIFSDPGRQLRLIVGKTRRVESVHRI